MRVERESPQPWDGRRGVHRAEGPAKAPRWEQDGMFRDRQGDWGLQQRKLGWTRPGMVNRISY